MMKLQHSPSPYVMVFDTETTGLYPRKTVGFSPVLSPKGSRELRQLLKDLNEENYPVRYFDNSPAGLNANPHLTQLSYVIVDVSKPSAPIIVDVYNEYIRLPEAVEISAEAEKITGITKEICMREGVDVVEALLQFLHQYERCRCIVGHNIEFDINIIRTQIVRNLEELKQTIPFVDIYFNSKCDVVFRKEDYCTMRRTMKICNISMPTKMTLDGVPSKRLKMPKLMELYRILFHSEVENLHNSLIDVLVCMRCYLKVVFHQDVDDAYFALLLRNAVENRKEEVKGLIPEFDDETRVLPVGEMSFEEMSFDNCVEYIEPPIIEMSIDVKYENYPPQTVRYMSLSY